MESSSLCPHPCQRPMESSSVNCGPLFLNILRYKLSRVSAAKVLAAEPDDHPQDPLGRKRAFTLEVSLWPPCLLTHCSSVSALAHVCAHTVNVIHF